MRTPTGIVLIKQAGLAGLLVGVLLLTVACESDLTTSISVASPEKSSVSVSLSFDPDATDALTPELDKQLTDLVKARIDQVPHRSRDAGKLTLSATIPYAVLIENQDVFGVAQTQLSPGTSSDKQLALTTTLVYPQGLDEAFEQASADQPDAQALAAAFKGSTNIVLKIAMPAEIDDVRFVNMQGEAQALEVERSPREVVVSQPLSEFQPGTLLVVSASKSSSTVLRQTLLASFGVLLLALAVVMWVSRRPRPVSRPSRRPQSRPSPRSSDSESLERRH